ncbi:MAG: ABC transporter substrate-binding protein [Gluconacetobacter diazotrophicus]|nr:ABC transporter substrate-binding protein [Gluconacetobacter diazotrophicus]
MSGTVRIGLLRLADAAPAIVGAEWGIFARHGLAAGLSMEPSWANVADKLAYGLLDAAVMLPPLAMAMAAGGRGRPVRLLVPMGLSRGGDTVVLSADAFEAVTRLSEGAGDVTARGRAVAEWAKGSARNGTPPRLGVVHRFSNHNLLLRHWLAANGADPDRNAATVVLPPAEMPAALADGRIDGFCAGAPWGTVAEQRSGGRVVARGGEIRRDRAGKVLAVRQDWADAEPDRLRALMRALAEAARCCDDPARGDALAALLAGPEHVAADAGSIRSSLPGAEPSDADPIGFGDALQPDMADASWFADALLRWNWLADADRAAAEAVYRPELAAAILG